MYLINRHGFSFLLCAILFALCTIPAFGNITFDDGGVHNVDAAGVGRIFVEDGSGGAPTTVNILAGADYMGMDVRGSSIVNVFDGSISRGEYNIFDTSMVHVTGGTFNVNVDAVGNSHLVISGGTFNGLSRTVAGFSDSTVEITGGTFNNNVRSLGQSELTISGGIFTDTVNSNGDATARITGGSFTRIVSDGSAIVTIVGTDFSSPGINGGATLMLPHVIDDPLNSTITGTLISGEALNSEIFNRGIFIGGPKSQIILEMPEPTTLVMLAVGLTAAACTRRSFDKISRR